MFWSESTYFLSVLPFTLFFLLILAYFLYFYHNSTYHYTSSRTAHLSKTLSTSVSACGSEVIDIEDLVGISLIPSTLNQLKRDNIRPLTAQDRAEKKKEIEKLGLPKFQSTLKKHDLSLTRFPTTVFQLNIGLYCNQACTHCHVDSSPKRKEMMHRDVADKCLVYACFLKLLSCMPRKLFETLHL